MCTLAALGFALLAGCAKDVMPPVKFPPEPVYPPDHSYTLDELIDLSVYRNPGLDAARYEADAVQGLVDQVKALYLPDVRLDSAAFVYDNNLNYKANVYNVASLNIPLTGAYNFVNSLAFTQIVATFGKRTSGLKQARMYAVLRKLDVVRQQDLLAFSVANFYYLVGLTNDIDGILEDATRRVAVFRQVAHELNRRGSLRANELDYLQAEYLVSQLEQLRVAAQASRYQAYEALKKFVGFDRDDNMLLREATLPPALNASKAVSVTANIVSGFLCRPETRELELFRKIREEQVVFAKKFYTPNIALFGSYVDTQGNHHAILNAVDGLILSTVMDVPIYTPVGLGRLREALATEQQAVALQHEVEQLLQLEIDVTTMELQRSLATLVKAARSQDIARQHYNAARQAYTRELVPASSLIIAIGLDALARVEYRTSLYALHNARASLRRVTGQRETCNGY
jgi:outer membrane protein TolC